MGSLWSNQLRRAKKQSANQSSGSAKQTSQDLCTIEIALVKTLKDVCHRKILYFDT